jgi:hypothetical protein
MAPKPAGATSGPEVLVQSDAFARAAKIKEAGLKPTKPKPPDLTEEDLSLPPSVSMGSLEFKSATNYWQNASTVKFSEQGTMRVPEDVLNPQLGLTSGAGGIQKSASDSALVRKFKKDVQDQWKYMKTQVKLAEKGKKLFFGTFTKVETKNEKRNTLLKQIKDVEDGIEKDLRDADEYAKKNRLFAIKYLYGSKLGAEAPPKDIVVVAEVSDKMVTWMENAKNDILPFFTGVIEKSVESFNMMLFSSAGVTPYMPTFTPTVPEGKVKKGAADCQKWLGKQYNPKAAGNAPWPPDWLQLVETLVKEEEALPSAVYIVCSKAPMPLQNVLERMNDIRTMKGIDLPIHVVSYDPDVAGDFNQEGFFNEFVGPKGSFQVDTSKRDMEHVDALLANVKKKKKQLEKLNKKVGKMEDLTEKVEDLRGLLSKQISVENMLRNDWILHEQALKTPAA